MISWKSFASLIRANHEATSTLALLETLLIMPYFVSSGLSLPLTLWLSLTSLPLARAKPPPRRSTMPHGNFFWATFQVSRGDVEPAAWWGATDPTNSLLVLNVCTVSKNMINCMTCNFFREPWLTCVKTLTSPCTETWGFRGQNKE